MANSLGVAGPNNIRLTRGTDCFGLPDISMKTGPLLTTGLPQFLKEGGYLRYVPSTDEDGKTTWELFGVGADGKVRTVWVTSTSQRTFRSASSNIYSFW
mgnify:CR=1 FL=1